MRNRKIMAINPLLKLSQWQADETAKKYTSIDMHTAGEPLRICLDTFPMPDNFSVLNFRNHMKSKQDQIRTSLMFEPRGHADMYGCIITEAEKNDSDFGVIFLHSNYYIIYLSILEK